jgi:hypothetical protein
VCVLVYNAAQLLEHVTQILTQLLEERLVDHRFNQLGAIQLDKASCETWVVDGRGLC